MRHDGRGRVIVCTAPDGQRIQFDYNDRNLSTQGRRYPGRGSPEVGQVLTVDAEHQAHWDVIIELTDA